MDKVIKHGLIFNAGFNPKSKDDMKRAVQDIISSASNINFDTPENRKQLKAFISVFRDMFESVGNKKIDFAAMFKMPGPEMFDAFKNSAEEVADVWAQVVNRIGTTSLRNVFMKDAQSLNDAFERLKKNGKVVTNRIEHLGRAFSNIRYTDVNKLLNEAIGEETRFTNAENWEERTAAALRYINIRDKILNIKNSDNFNPKDIKVEWASFFKDITSAEHTLGSYLIRDLKEVVPEMQTSLNNIFNLYQGKEIDLVPKVIQPLSVRDLIAGKQDKVEIPAELKLKLDAYRTAFQGSDTELRDKLEKEITSLFPPEVQDNITDRLWSFGRLPNLSDRNYNAIWKDFVNNNISLGGGSGAGLGGGTGVGSGIGSGQTDGATIGEVQNLEAIRTKVTEVTSAVEAKTQAFNNEATTVNTVVESEIQQLTKLEEKIKTIDGTLRGLLTNIKSGDKDLGAGLSNIIVNVNHQNQEKQVTDGNTENTFNAVVLSILENIQKNTETLKSLQPNKDIKTILTSIKTAIESVDKKIVRGTKTIIGGEDVKSKKKTSTAPKENTKTNNKDIDNQRETEKNQLIKQYRELGELEAKVEVNKTNEAKVRFAQLEQEVIAKRQSLQLSEEELGVLQQIRNIAKEENINVLTARQSDKDIKNQLANERKMAQREAMLGKTGNAIGRAENTWMSALNIENMPVGFEAQLNEYYNKLDTLRKKHQELKNSTLISEEQKQDLIAQTMNINKLTGEISNLVSQYNQLSGDNVSKGTLKPTTLTASSPINDYENELKNYVQFITNGQGQIKNFNAQTKTLTYTVKTGAHEFTDYTAAVRQLDHQLVSVQGTTRRTETFLESTKRKMKEITSYMSGITLIRRLTMTIRQGVQYVREIDLALTELKKVTDETEESYDKFLETAAKTGARLGSTISAVTEATATFAKLGYTMEQASEMAEAAIVYKNVGDGIASTEDAANSIISTLKGFGMEASEAMTIIDRFNEVGNKFAITSKGIGEALRLSASALNEGGNSLDESIAIITAANEVVNDPSSVGTALKTLTLRLRGSKTELEAMGEDVSDMATTTSQLQAKLLALTGGQVDIMLDENTFKNSTQILREMAAAWEDMNDIQRASALELMGGKRQANVLSALIQNFDTVEKVIETSANSAGSALKENERYLDSIQGKIDQFTNATQAMWNNFLNADVIKFLVELGTKLIKFVDNIGMIPSILGGIFIYLTAFKKQNPLNWIQSLAQYLHMFKGNGGFKQFLGQLLGIAPAMKMVTAETMANTVATQMNDAATAKDMMSKMGLAEVTGSLSIAQKEQAATAIFNAFTQGQLTQAQTNAMLATLGYKASLDGATWSLRTLDTATKSFMATNPIGWILAIVSVLMTVVMLISQIPSGIEKLTEELKDLKSEISDIESEIDSINSELKTTQDRMAELLALPSLSFTEQEELENLKRQNAELERQLELQNMLAKSKKAKLVETSEAYIDKVWNSSGANKSYYVGGDGRIYEDKGWNGFWTAGVNTKDALDASMQKYIEIQTKRNKVDSLASSITDGMSVDEYKEILTTLYGPEILERAQGHMPDVSTLDVASFGEALAEYHDLYDAELINISDGINMVFADENFDNLTYGMSDEINKFLDEMYAYQYKWQETQGISAKSSAIASIFDDTSSKSVKKLKEDLTAIANDKSLDDTQKQAKGLELVSKAINNTAGDYDRLKTSMDIIGISADEVARYFVQLSKAPDSSTVEGITAQYQKGVDALSKYKGAATDIIAEFTNLDGQVEQITWGSLFDDNGETIDTQISKVLHGADETARTEFARIAEAINEGKISVDNAMKSFSVSGVQAGYKLLENAVIEINTDVFKDLGDEISGLIDTFDEFGSALESVAKSIELVNQANAEMAYSGHVSVETALDLIDSTENWNEVLEIENGQIKLLPGAIDAVAQAKLNQTKTNLQLALSEAQAGLEQARLAESSGEVAKTLEESTTESVRQLAANMEYLSTLIGEFLRGNFLGAGSAAKTAKENSLKSTEYQKTSTAPSMSVADWEEKVSDIEAKLGILEGVDTPGEFENNYYSDKVSGGNNTEKDVEDDRFQKEMDYWENRIAANQAKYEQLQNEIDLLEQKGQKADASFYQEQIGLEQERQWLLEQQKTAARARLQAIEDAGQEGSDEWWEVANTLNDIEGELDDVTASILDLQDAIGEIDAYKFEEFNNRLDNLTSKLETIRNLIAPDGEEDWFDDEGNWTEAGVSVLGSLTQELEMYKQGYQETMDELAKYEPDYELNKPYYETLGIHSEQEYYDKTEELISQQYDFAESISDTEQSVIDMYESSIDAVEEYVDTLIDGYNDYIDSVKEALDAERELYDFKKNVQKQAKDIAEIERRIMSLSGSTNAADIAERRKLEAQLYESRESLNDTYYDHAKESQNEALDAEQTAYEESMTRFIEDLRMSLEEATNNMDEFLMGVTSMVMYNADTVLAKYEETNLPLTTELTNPWIKAKEAVGTYSGDALALMSKWTESGGFFEQFSATGTTNMQSPWIAGTNAANTFKTSVSSVMSGVVSNIATNVKTASGELSKLYQQIQDTEQRASNANIVVSGSGSGDGGSSGYVAPQKKYYVTAFLDMGSRSLSVTKSDVDASKAMSAAKIAILGEYEKIKGNSIASESAWQRTWRNKVKYTTQYYAKGTPGTKRDGFAITDESWIGEEITLAAGKNGQLQYLKKGSSVLPADISANLIEWGKLDPTMLDLTNPTANINMINNAVNKPEFNLSFDSLVHVDHCDEGTLKNLEKMVDTKINDFSKQLNYSIKKFAR